MKWLWSVINIKPSRLLQIIMILAVIKIGFMFAMFGSGEQAADGTAVKPLFVEARTAMAVEGGPETEVQEEQPVDISQELQRIRAREAELDRRERNLRMLQQDIDDKLQELTRLEASLDRMLEEADVLKDQKIRHLVDVYSNMNAKQAAQVLETLDETISVKILSGMRGRQAGDILTHVDSRKAARLSELLTELQTPFVD